MPAFKETVWPEGQLLIAACIAGWSFPPLGEIVAQIVFLNGMPPGMPTFPCHVVNRLAGTMSACAEDMAINITANDSIQIFAFRLYFVLIIFHQGLFCLFLCRSSSSALKVATSLSMRSILGSVSDIHFITACCLISIWFIVDELMFVVVS